MQTLIILTLFTLSVLAESNQTYAKETNEEYNETNNCNLLNSCNRRPIANFEHSKTSNSLKLRFDASSSKDLDGTIINYSWDFGDGLVSDGVITEHSFLIAGTYNVQLTVKDNNGSISRKRIMVFAGKTGNVSANVYELYPYKPLILIVDTPLMASSYPCTVSGKSCNLIKFDNELVLVMDEVPPGVYEVVFRISDTEYRYNFKMKSRIISSDIERKLAKLKSIVHAFAEDALSLNLPSQDLELLQELITESIQNLETLNDDEIEKLISVYYEYFETLISTNADQNSNTISNTLEDDFPEFFRNYEQN